MDKLNAFDWSVVFYLAIGASCVVATLVVCLMEFLGKGNGDGG